MVCGRFVAHADVEKGAGMSDVNHMENRLRAALSRMEDAVTKLPDPSAVIASEQQRTELAAQLQAERESNAELEKRIENYRFGIVF